VNYLALLERPGELVSKDELIARVWPNTFVEHANLAVQIAGLRRALGDGVGQTRYVIDIPGRGYRFVAPVAIEAEFSSDATEAAEGRAEELPLKLLRSTAPVESVDDLAHKLRQGALAIARRRGCKADVALALVEKLLGSDRSGVWLLDLRGLGDS
jgi:DNA-binding winged helix-turn-helix (wHTH) protein